MIFLTIAGVALGAIGVFFAMAFYLQVGEAEAEIDRLHESVKHAVDSYKTLEKCFDDYRAAVGNRINFTTVGNRIDRFM